MTVNRQKLNGTAKWIIVFMAVAGLIFNSGVLYNHVQHLTEQVTEMKISINCLDEKIDMLQLQVVQGGKDDTR